MTRFQQEAILQEAATYLKHISLQMLWWQLAELANG